MRSPKVHPLLASLDATGEALAGVLRLGDAGSGAEDDHVTVLADALAQVPIDPTEVEVTVRADSAGWSHATSATSRRDVGIPNRRRVRVVGLHMPTASDYVTGSSVFRQLATSTTERAQWLAYSLPEATIGPCPVRSTLDKDLGVSLRNLVNSANEFSTLATTCTRRAVICTEFDAEVKVHEIELAAWEATPEGQRGPQPVEPSPPYSWVERSR